MITGVPRRILPAIVFSQFSGVSVWFAGNAVMPDLIRDGGLPADALGDVTAAVQLGFIAGTLVFAVLAIADRLSPRRVFLVSAVLAAITNGVICITGAELWPLLALRFATGFWLAGIYPVGMRIAAGWFDKNLGSALGFLVGALVLGTALPHLIRALGQDWPWQAVILSASAVAVLGGAVMYVFVPDGPHLRLGARFDVSALTAIFRSADFRASSFGYFGHMWELYTFWAFVPAYIVAHEQFAGANQQAISFVTFLVIGFGLFGCVLGGLASRTYGSARVAKVQLSASGICCLISPLALLLPLPALVVYLLFWGIVVAGDSPQFSALNARTAPPELVGSALTIINCIGFSISVVSIQFVNELRGELSVAYLFLLLAPGPLLGLLALRRQ